MRTSRLALCSLAALVIGWSFTAHGDQDPSDSTERSTQGDVQYSVAVSGERAILVDTASGKTWLLSESPVTNEPPAWLPLERIDDAAVARRWRHVDRATSEDEELSDLQTQLKVAAKRYAPGHPRVLELREKVKRLEQNLQQRQSELPDQRSKPISQQLFPLLLQEMELLQSHGEDHPEVVTLRKKIELMRELIKLQLLDDEVQ